ncbi:ribosomal protein S18-alanine N-acetyltransferase [Alkalihalobacillus sp. AL-G]|uniref:ribosomal protein S18-alanine N-acetyltransferase n=1 Tax=Alkalihalobacillus sp. AL-G TaxID=2926399 RepID=UPI002729C880|nr:ribosomal protein S18-alanine N-acetyltransferase [Alkalihalobacillus sp. AL-G]WLD93688.1 ribosomal protein S18-alanine N-acetyltransferase [Alkalihalobacillus sp. AL-G]
MVENITFRVMTLEDLEAILKIEHTSFPNPWSRTAFYNEVVNNQFATYLLLEIDGQVIGYCGIWIIIDEAHITNIAILPEYRGKNYGEALFRKAIDEARRHGAKTMTLEVRLSNRVAQNMYRKFGFENGGIRKNYYTDNGEDALVMWVNL